MTEELCSKRSAHEFREELWYDPVNDQVEFVELEEHVCCMNLYRLNKLGHVFRQEVDTYESDYKDARHYMRARGLVKL